MFELYNHLREYDKANTKETTKLYNSDYNNGYNAGFYAQQKGLIDTNPGLAKIILIFVGVLFSSMLLFAIIKGPDPKLPPQEYYQEPQGYYQDSFNNSFNDNSWKWDFCAGYCPR